MHLANSSPPTEPNLLALLFPAAVPAASNALPVALDDGHRAEFDQLFPDLAPAPSTTVPVAQSPEATDFAIYITGSLTPPVPACSVPGPDAVVCSETTGSPRDVSLESVAEQPGSRGEDQGQLEGAPRPTRLTVRAARASQRNALPGPSATPGEPLPATNNSLQVAGGLPVVPRFDEHPSPVVDAATHDMRLFPRSDGLPTTARERRVPQGTPISIGAESDPCSERAFPFDSPEASALTPGDRTIAREVYTRPLGFFTTPVSLTNEASPYDATVPGPERADAVATRAMVGVNKATLIPEAVPGFADMAATTAGQALPRPQPAAKFAAGRVKNPTLEAALPIEVNNSFVGAEAEPVTPQRKSLGIDGAKLAPTMFARFLPAPLQHPASEYAAAAVVSPAGLTELVAPSQVDGLVPETVSSAQDAVEVVLQAAELVSSRQQKSVSLQFSVGDADLSVRVELHANEVRATFRTDSPELRDALSHEWQAVASTSANGDRTFRIVPAVITASDQSALNAFAGGASSRQRDPHAQHGASERPSTAMGRARGPATVAAPVSSLSRGGLLAASLTSLHLHTLA